jgi:hypothetical protein
MSAVTPAVGVAAVGSIGASVVSATSTSIAGSISGCGEVSGAVGAVCCGSIGSVGSVVAGGENADRLRVKFAFDRRLERANLRRVNVAEHH